MSDRDRRDEEDQIELSEGDSLEAALAEEESRALSAAEEKLRAAQKDLEDRREEHLREGRE